MLLLLFIHPTSTKWAPSMGQALRSASRIQLICKNRQSPAFMELTAASNLISPSQIHSSYSGLLDIVWTDQTYPNLRGPAVSPRTSFLTYLRLHVPVWKTLPDHPKWKSLNLQLWCHSLSPVLVFLLRRLSSAGTYGFAHDLLSQLEGKSIYLHRQDPGTW